MSAERALPDLLLSKLQDLEVEFQKLTTDSKDALEPHQAAEGLQKDIHHKIDTALANLNNMSGEQLVTENMDRINHELMMDVLKTIKTKSLAIDNKIKNNLHLLSQHTPTRNHLFAIIDQIVEINQLTETSSDYNTDYDELAKEIRQIIRSIPKLDAAIQTNNK